MEEVAENITQDEVLELIGDFPIIPTRTRMVISVNTTEEDEVDLEGVGFDPTQFVLAVGSQVTKDIVPGCKVLLALEKMVSGGQMGGPLELKPVEVKGRVFAMITDSFVDAIDNR